MKQQRQSKGLYFYTPEQYELEVDLLITFTALSHGQLISLDDLYESKRHSEYTYQTCRLAIKTIEDKEGNILPFTSLSPRTLTDVAAQIMEASSVPQDTLDTLQTSVNIKFGGTFNKETWNCDICKAKRLDKVRNCGYRDEKSKDPSFKIVADNQVYTHCPIYDVDQDIIADAVDCYVMYDKKLLPDAGGLYDQTRFFVLSSSIITQKIREEEAKEAKKTKKKK